MQYATFLPEIKSRTSAYHLSLFLVLTMCKFLPEANSLSPVNSIPVSASESNFAALAFHIRKELHESNKNLHFFPLINPKDLKTYWHQEVSCWSSYINASPDVRCTGWVVKEGVVINQLQMKQVCRNCTGKFVLMHICLTY